MYRGVYIMQSCIIIAYIVGYIFQVIGHHSEVSLSYVLLFVICFF